MHRTLAALVLAAVATALLLSSGQAALAKKAPAPVLTILIQA